MMKFSMMLTVYSFFVVILAFCTYAVMSKATLRSDNEMLFSVYVEDEDTKVVIGKFDSANANAYGSYQFNSSVSGWNYFEVHAKNNPASVKDQFVNIYAMGYAEGYATCHELHTFWPNFYHDIFRGDVPGPKTLSFIKQQWDWMGAMIEENAATDQFWFAQKQTRRQLEGLLAGYKAGCVSPDAKTPDRPEMFWATLDNPSIEHLLLINAWGDLYQITAKMKEPGQFSRLFGRMQNTLIERCSAFVRVLPDLSDVVFGHNTWDSYEAMGPRIFKKLHFPLWQVSDASVVPFTTLFSSSPGLLSSIDDFFVVKGRGHLGVQETTNTLYNLQVLNTVTPTAALSWQRSTAANQLASNGQEWAKAMATHSSGTYSNQWMVLDLALFTAGKNPETGFFTVYEDVPGLVHFEDMTSTLISQAYWGSFNNPYFSDIRDRAGYTNLCNKGFTSECYEGASRYTIFKEQHSNVIDIESMQHIMRYNEWQTDAASKGNSCHAIACRGDLNSKNDDGAFGALDAKMSSVKLASKGDGCNALAVIGPTHQDQTVFCWSAYADRANYVYQGQPDCFDFDWVAMPPSTTA